jgi:hypothetical protein
MTTARRAASCASKALETKLRALRRARKRALEATSVREVAELDDAIASIERALGPSS